MLLVELRTNPQSNVKRSPLDTLTSILETTAETERDKLFVTFTIHKKFGTNPRSQYTTPLGLYSYPLDFVVKQKMNVPYAAKSPHIWVFRAEDCWSLQGEYDAKIHKRLQQAMYDCNVEPDDNFLSAKSNTALYRAIKSSLHSIGYSSKFNPDNKQQNPNIILRKIFLRAGISGVVDFGSGTIYKTEPYQMVYFKVPLLEVISYVPNSFTVKSDAPMQPPSSKDVMDFEQYYDYVVMGNNKRDVALEQRITFKHDPSEYELRKFIMKTIMQRGGRIQFLEKYIAKNPSAGLLYARDLLQKRFYRGEPLMKRDLETWRIYASIFPEVKYGAR